MALFLALRSVLSFRHNRQRAQGLVEYSLIAATLAFAGVVGFTAIAGAEKAYISGMPMDPVPPSAPGALLHPTSVDTPSCSPSNPILLATLIQCTTTVHDTFSNPNDRNPPSGTVDWLLDGTPIPGAVCALSAIDSATSACPSPLSYTPLGAALIGTHTLTAKYGRASAADPPWETLGSNHLPSSSSISLVFIEHLVFSVSCVNALHPAWPEGKVEIGSPLQCTVNLKDANDGLPGVPKVANVSWSTHNGGTDQGIGVFTCFATVSQPLSSCWRPNIVPDGTATGACTTDPATGVCSVMYRRLFDNAGRGVGNTTPLTLIASASSYSYSLINVVASTTVHPTGAAAVCTSTDPYVSFLARTPNPNFGLAQFSGTEEVHVHPAASSISVTCTATIVDISPSPTTSSTADPNFYVANPPFGLVHFTWNEADIGPLAQCMLVRVDLAGPPTAQVQGQAPFISSCTAGPFTINDTQDHDLDVEFDPQEGPLPTHAPVRDANEYQILVDMDGDLSPP